MKKVQAQIMKGFSFALPFFITATLMRTILLYTNYEFQGLFVNTEYALSSLGYIVLTGYIAYAVSDKLALLPGLLAGSLVATSGLGFIGAIMIGLIAGYIVLLLKLGLKKIGYNFKSTLTIVWIPLVSVVLIYFVYLGLNLFMPTFTSYYEQLFINLNLVSQVALCAVLAVFMAYDLGGPMNKFAYVLAISTIGLYMNFNALIPAVMVGGMIPSLTIGLYHMMNKKVFNESNNQKPWSVLLLGAFFISEGGLHYYHTYGKKVMIPSLIGAMISGAMIGYFNVLSIVPHGGLLVFWTTSKPWLFLLSIAIGTLLSLIILVFTMKENELKTA